MTMALLNRVACRILSAPSIRNIRSFNSAPILNASRREHIRKAPRMKLGPERRPLDDSHPFKRSTLEDMTTLFAPTGSPVFSTIQDLLWHLPLCTYDQLAEKLERYATEPERWLILRNALLAQSWPQIREVMRAGIMDSEWPTFVLQRGVRLTSTLSEVSDALAVLQQRIRGMRINRARSCFDVLAFKALNDLPGIHLATRLVDTFIELMESTEAKGGWRPPADMAIFITSLLVRHDDDRARSNARRLLGWAKSDEELRQRLAALFLGIGKKQFVYDLERGQLDRPSRRPISTGTFLTVDMVDHLLSIYKDQDRRPALRVAMLIAGRRRAFYKAKDYFLAIREPNQKDLYALVLALSRAPYKRDAWESLSELAESNRTLEIVLDMLARDPDVSLARTFSMLMVQMEGTTEDMLIASRGVSEEFTTNVKAYAMAMTGLTHRQEPEYAEKVWEVMRARGIIPNTAALTTYINCLFKQGKERNALEAVKLWCLEGVDVPVKPAPTTLLDIDDLQPYTSNEMMTVKLDADLPLAHTLFRGLAKTPTIHSVWKALHASLLVIPDAPILWVLLRSSTTNKDSALKPHLATAIFRRMLITQHPELLECSASEVLRGHSWAARSEIGMRNLERWMKGLFFKDGLGEWDAPVQLTFTPPLFEEYVNVLLHLQWEGSGFFAAKNDCLEEMVLALVWMRRLELTPRRKTVAAICLELNELFPPLGDEDSNAGVVREWLRPEEYPTDEEMQETWDRKYSK